MMVTFFFFNDTATTEIYTLSLHDALPISTQDKALAMRIDLKINQISTIYSADMSIPYLGSSTFLFLLAKENGWLQGNELHHKHPYTLLLSYQGKPAQRTE